MCLTMLGWLIVAVLVGGVVAFFAPIVGLILFLVILIFGIVNSHSVENQKIAEQTEIEKALWLANDAEAIAIGNDYDSFRITDEQKFSELPAEVRMTLDMSGLEIRKEKRE